MGLRTLRGQVVVGPGTEGTKRGKMKQFRLEQRGRDLWSVICVANINVKLKVNTFLYWWKWNHSSRFLSTFEIVIFISLDCQKYLLGVFLINVELKWLTLECLSKFVCNIISNFTYCKLNQLNLLMMPIIYILAHEQCHKLIFRYEIGDFEIANLVCLKEKILSYFPREYDQ